MLVPAALVSRRAARAASVPGGTLDPATVPKYVTPMFVIPAMPPSGGGFGLDTYSIASRRFSQQMLPSGYGRSTVLGFGSTTDASTFWTPGYTIEAQVNRQTRVTWWNQFVDGRGHFVPHPLTVDPTLHWANPPGGITDRDSQPVFDTTPPPYTGPVPLVVHLHGAHSYEESDGYPQAWTLPVARDIPRGYAQVGSFYDQFKAEARARFGAVWQPGNSILQYGNDQRATALWYHSHDLGMTRVNLNAGLAGMYLLRGGSSDLPPGVLPGPAPYVGMPQNAKCYELPLVIQDKSFNADGSIFFPDSRGFFGDTDPDGPWVPDTDTSPYWNPEFFGNTMMVNGNTWPSLTVEARRYRFRILNASNARTLLLKIVTNPLAARPASAALPLWVIGADGGFLPAPTTVDTMWLGVAERADVIVDFSNVPVGSHLYLINEGPDEPYHGGVVGVDFEPADPPTTGQVMKFTVVPATSRDTSVPPNRLHLPAIPGLPGASVTRHLSLNELDSGVFEDAPVAALLGTINPDGTGNPLRWHDPVTENPALGATEIWEVNNFTDDGHPIHVHLVQFQVLSRQPFGGAPRPPESWETGTKDTVLSFPNETTRIKATFDLAGRFVWHCHILDHEDNEMMRPYQVG
jgi:FtsP/CotA-like multicopper oxidase with cupredoxin domain